MKKYNHFLMIFSLVNIITTFCCMFFGPRLYHILGVLFVFDQMESTNSNALPLQIIGIKILLIATILLIFLYIILRILLLFTKKTKSWRIISHIICADSIIDAIACFVFVIVAAVRNYGSFTAREEADIFTPWFFTAIVWSAVLISLIIAKIKVKDIGKEFIFTMGLYGINLVTFLVVWVIMSKDMSMFMFYTVTFTFVEDIVLILLLMMRKKEMERISIGQTAVLHPDENELSDGTI